MAGQAIPASTSFYGGRGTEDISQTSENFNEFYRSRRLKRTRTEVKKIEEKAYAMTRKIHISNGRIHPHLNTMHSRRGKSSRIQFHQLWNRYFSRRPHGHRGTGLKATIEGLGTCGEVPVFPIQIFKVEYLIPKRTIRVTENLAALEGNMEFQAPTSTCF